MAKPSKGIALPNSVYLFQLTQGVSSMQTSLSAMLQMPASRRFMSDAFLPDDEALSDSLAMSDLSEAVLSESSNAFILGDRTRAEPVECPKCSKHSIIRRSHNTFDCLNCNFHKELPPIAISDPACSPKTSRKLIYSQPPTARPSFDELSNISGTDKIQPLVFAVIAVIIGIIIL
jgi:predicted RNA-binding Zn-ribbon protein involved in translation (DUF1610 family)